MSGTACCCNLRDSRAGGPLVPGEPQPLQAFVGHISTDRALGLLNQFLQLGQDGSISLARCTGESIGSPALSWRRNAALSWGPPPQHSRGVRTPGGIECFQNLNDLPVRFLHSPSGEVGSSVVRDLELCPGGTPHCGPTRPAHTSTKGRSVVRRAGDELSAYKRSRTAAAQ